MSEVIGFGRLVEAIGKRQAIAACYARLSGKYFLDLSGDEWDEFQKDVQENHTALNSVFTKMLADAKTFDHLIVILWRAPKVSEVAAQARTRALGRARSYEKFETLWNVGMSGRSRFVVLDGMAKYAKTFDQMVAVVKLAREDADVLARMLINLMTGDRSFTQWVRIHELAKGSLYEDRCLQRMADTATALDEWKTVLSLAKTESLRARAHSVIDPIEASAKEADDRLKEAEELKRKAQKEADDRAFDEQVDQAKTFEQWATVAKLCVGEERASDRSLALAHMSETARISSHWRELYELDADACKDLHLNQAIATAMTFQDWQWVAQITSSEQQKNAVQKMFELASTSEELLATEKMVGGERRCVVIEKLLEQAEGMRFDDLIAFTRSCLWPWTARHFGEAVALRCEALTPRLLDQMKRVGTFQNWERFVRGRGEKEPKELALVACEQLVELSENVRDRQDAYVLLGCGHKDAWNTLGIEPDVVSAHRRKLLMRTESVDEYEKLNPMLDSFHAVLHPDFLPPDQQMAEHLMSLCQTFDECVKVLRLVVKHSGDLTQGVISKLGDLVHTFEEWHRVWDIGFIDKHTHRDEKLCQRAVEGMTHCAVSLDQWAEVVNHLYHGYGMEVVIGRLSLVSATFDDWMNFYENPKNLGFNGRYQAISELITRKLADTAETFDQWTTVYQCVTKYHMAASEDADAIQKRAIVEMSKLVTIE